MKIVKGKPNDAKLIFWDKESGYSVVAENDEFEKNKFIVFKMQNKHPTYYYIPDNMYWENNQVVSIKEDFFIVGCGKYIIMTKEFVVLIGQSKYQKIGEPPVVNSIIVAKLMPIKFTNIFKKAKNYLMIMDKNSEPLFLCDYLVFKRSIKDSKGKYVNIVAPKILKNKVTEFIVVKRPQEEIIDNTMMPRET